MTLARVSSDPLLTLETGGSSARMSDAPALTLETGGSKARTSAVPLLVLRDLRPPTRVSSAPLLLLIPGDATVTTTTVTPPAPLPAPPPPAPPSSSGTDLTNGIGLELYYQGAWHNHTADARMSEGIICEYGIWSSDPIDRVAGSGSLKFSLDNSDQNSLGTMGAFSPGGPNCISGFDFNIPVRWSLQVGGDKVYKHYGHLTDINVAPGRHESRLTRCQSLDFMDDAARADLPELAAVQTKRADELLTSILAALTTSPRATSLGTGASTFVWAFDGGTGQRLKVREEFLKIAQSEQGYIYPKGDRTGGGTVYFEPRGYRAANATTRITFSDDMSRDGGLILVGSRDDIYRTVEVTVHPTTIDGSTVVLWSLSGATTAIANGASLDTVTGNYRNPTTNEACGGTAMVAPVATTDYTANTAEDGTGTDVTNGISVAAVYTGQGVRYSIVNASGFPAYIRTLQARGKGVYRTDVTISKTVTGSYGDRALQIDLPYGTSVNAATSIATYLANVLSSPLARARSVKFCATRTAALMQAAILREPSDQIAITETVSGLVGALFNIQGVRLELAPPDLLWCTWNLQPATMDPWWVDDGVTTGSTAFAATGGTVTTAGGYTYHTFQSNSTFRVTSGSATVQYSCVGAGGSGGGLRGGGGGGGGVLDGSFAVTVGDYTVTVGTGSSGTNGGDSAVFGVTALGGGKGGTSSAGSSGGSGGAGSGPSRAGAAGTSGQGYAGGNGAVEDGGGSDDAGGGGGGAGIPGANADYYLGNGGAGRAVFGTTYGGGGGGNQDTASGNGGAGGGGDGGAGGNPSTGGTDYLGGGGGGGESKRGGHGTVIIRYATP